MLSVVGVSNIYSAKIKQTYVLQYSHTRILTHTCSPHRIHGYLGRFTAVQYHFQHSVTAGGVGTDSEVAPVGSCCNALLRKHLLVQVVHQLITGSV